MNFSTEIPGRSFHQDLLKPNTQQPTGPVSAIESIPPYRGVGRGAGVKRGRGVEVSFGEWLLGMRSTVLTWIGTGRRPRSQSFPESRRIIPAPTNDT